MTRGRWISLVVGTAIAMAVAVSVSRHRVVSPKRAATLASKGGKRAHDRARVGGPPIRNSPTARGDLQKTVAAMEARLGRTPTAVASAVTLADALLRQTRVTGNAGLAMRAESALNTALAGEPANYNARRMLAAVYLSQHRFTDP